MDQFTDSHRDKVSQMDERTIITRDLSQFKHLFQQQEMFRGVDTGCGAELTAEEKEQKKQAFDEAVRKDIRISCIPLPEKLFKDFTELKFNQRHVFRDVVEGVLIEYKAEKKEKAILFPAVLDTHGRQLIHQIAREQGLASYSSKGDRKHKLTYVFQRHLFLAEQEKEKHRLAEEVARIKEKLENGGVLGIDQPNSLRAHLVKAVKEGKEVTEQLLDKITAEIKLEDSKERAKL